jgi:hypothetical protein
MRNVACQVGHFIQPPRDGRMNPEGRAACPELATLVQETTTPH